MSVKQSWLVWEKEIGGRDQLILLALADMADDDGGSLWPSMAYIEWKTGLSKDTVRRSLKALAGKGVIEKIAEAGPRHSAQYVLHLDKLRPKEKWRGGKLLSLRSQDASPGVANSEGRGSKMPSDPIKQPTNRNYHLNGYPDAAGRILEFLNEKSGKHFKLKDPDNQLTSGARLIIDRLKGKYTEDEMRQVIMHKIRKWKGSDMEKYIRPSTLFRKSNFENYLAELQ